MHLLVLAGKTLLFRRASFALLVVVVAGAVGLQIANAANLRGYSRELVTRGVVDVFGHVVVSAAEGEPMAQIDDTRARLAAEDGVAVVAPRFGQPGVMFHRGRRQPVTAVGLDPDAEQRANRLCDRLRAGRCPRAGARELLVGGRLADRLELAVGDSVRLAFPLEDIDELRVAQTHATVVGVLAPSGGFSVVELGAFLPIDDLRALLDWGHAATSLSLYLDDGAAADAVAARLGPLLGAKLVAKPWHEVNPDIQFAIDGNATILKISQAMVVLAVLFPTLALFWIAVLRERRQIAALAAIGFGRGALFTVYLVRALLVAAVGAALGSAIGVALCRWFQGHPLYAHQGFVVTPDLDAHGLGLAVALVVLVTVGGGLAPALQAAWANPAQALRDA
jgi:ABC-type lipoprotein release transport system permease subunit